MNIPVQVCGDELNLGEEVFYCHWPTHNPDILHEAPLPQFTIVWDDEGDHRTYYHG
jgi:hypothetical protein